MVSVCQSGALWTQLLCGVLLFLLIDAFSTSSKERRGETSHFGLMSKILQNSIVFFGFPLWNHNRWHYNLIQTVGLLRRHLKNFFFVFLKFLGFMRLQALDLLWSRILWFFSEWSNRHFERLSFFPKHFYFLNTMAFNWGKTPYKCNIWSHI